MPVVRGIRLLGFIISTIVLGLLTKGYKISVQKIAFMTLKGIKVEVPERGVFVQVEEISCSKCECTRAVVRATLLVPPPCRALAPWRLLGRRPRADGQLRDG
jgi:hypothetical protein